MENEEIRYSLPDGLVDDDVKVADEKALKLDKFKQAQKEKEEFKKTPEYKKQFWQRMLKIFAIITVLAFIRALGTYMFIVPNGFAPGGFSGIASIIYNAILPSNPELANKWFNPAITSLVMNIPFLILSFKILDRKFAIRTIFAVVVYSLWMEMFYLVDFPYFVASNSESGLNLLAAAAGGAACGVCLGFILRKNACLGGTDIIGKIIYKYNPIADVQWLILACDMVIVLASGALGFMDFDVHTATANEITTAILSPILYSAISLIVTTEVADVIQSGLQSSIVFNIISDKHEEIAFEITSKTHRGVTVVKAIGQYTGVEHDMLVCVARKKQISHIKALIAKVDPNAFVYITKAREVSGRGFSNYSGQ